MTNKMRLPGAAHQIAIMGRNGSGKTQMAAWVLSRANFDAQPWVVIDYKIDPLLNAIDRAHEIGLNDRIPKHPGVYLVHPRPDEQDETEKFLWKIWERGRTGLYIDEGYALPSKGAFNAILTQGRSKRIPRMVLTQRPSWISRFVFSESNFYSIFHLNDRRDQKLVGEFTPVDFKTPLPEYHSYYHDVDRHQTYTLRPVPDRDTILDRFDQRLSPPRRRHI